MIEWLAHIDFAIPEEDTRELREKLIALKDRLLKEWSAREP